jgi:recombination protein RecR
MQEASGIQSRKDANTIQRLLDEFERLPGIGPKSAQRIVYWLLNGDSADAHRLANTIIEVKDSVRFCSRCFNYATGELCAICAAADAGQRDKSLLCVVSEPRDISAIERTGEFSGIYHVLGGEISPMDDIGQDDLTIADLLKRLASTEIREVLLATNPSVEGETTAVLIARHIKTLGITTTRLASGLPVGGDLELADALTLGRAIEARREM